MSEVEFLEECLDEDESRASSGWSRLGDGRWERIDEGNSVMTPRAVLADIAAKRAIMNEIKTTRAAIRALPGGSARLAAMHGLDMMERHLLQPYVDRPGFDPAWRLPA